VLGEPGTNQMSLTTLLAGDDSDASNCVGHFVPSPDEVALMLLSGGTTGLPKMIPRTQ
jgi:non-ribosomal peptide synthetase component E (peptide arylation enzyme)